MLPILQCATHESKSNTIHLMNENLLAGGSVLSLFCKTYKASIAGSARKSRTGQIVGSLSHDQAATNSKFQELKLLAQTPINMSTMSSIEDDRSVCSSCGIQHSPFFHRHGGQDIAQQSLVCHKCHYDFQAQETQAQAIPIKASTEPETSAPSAHSLVEDSSLISSTKDAEVVRTTCE